MLLLCVCAACPFAAAPFQAVMEQGSVDNGTLADSQAQAAAIWRVREGVTEALQRRGEGQHAKTVLLCMPCAISTCPCFQT